MAALEHEISQLAAPVSHDIPSVTASVADDVETAVDVVVTAHPAASATASYPA